MPSFSPYLDYDNFPKSIWLGFIGKEYSYRSLPL